jgi:hypothetical protein
MAGFGVFMAYLSYSAVGIFLASVFALIFFLIGRKLVPQGIEGREGFLFACLGTPFFGLLWILLTFIVYSYIVGAVFHRDNWMSTDPHAPLPDGYILGAAHYGGNYIIPPGKAMHGCLDDGFDCVRGVLYLQISDPYLLGQKFRSDAEGVEFFMIDTRTGRVSRFATMDGLRAAAASCGVTVTFGEIWIGGWEEAYFRYRSVWFDWFFPAASLAGLTFLAASLFHYVRRLRADAVPASG